MLEAGVPVYVLKNLMGHTSLRTTAGYLHVSRRTLENLRTPLDLMSCSPSASSATTGPQAWGTEAQGTHDKGREAAGRQSLARPLDQGTTGVTSSAPTVSTRLAKIAEQSKREPGMVFTTLAHHMDEAFLTEAFHQLRKDAAAGTDQMTVTEYSQNLKENISGLHQRLVNRTYRAQPAKKRSKKRRVTSSLLTIAR